MLAAIADEAMALALFTLLPPDAKIATIQESTSFIRAVNEGTIIAEAQVLRKGRRVGFLECSVRMDDVEKTLLARTTASFVITLLCIIPSPRGGVCDTSLLSGGRIQVKPRNRDRGAGSVRGNAFGAVSISPLWGTVFNRIFLTKVLPCFSVAVFFKRRLKKM
jgi:hypothetical protein